MNEPRRVRIDGYEDLVRMGRGGMSEVFRARRVLDGRMVTLKLLMHNGDPSPSALQRMRREIAALQGLDHPHVVRCVEDGTQKVRPYIALEYVEGETLLELVQRVGPLPSRRVLELAEQLVEALQAVHLQGLVHRDVKPSNIFLSRDGILKLSDFGLAKRRDDAEVTRQGHFVGTPQFLAPEQITDCSWVDQRADVYSLGTTLFFLLTGKAPFHADSMDAVLTRQLTDELRFTAAEANRIPEPVRALVQRLCAKSPENRPADMQAVLDLVRRAGQGRSLSFMDTEDAPVRRFYVQREQGEPKPEISPLRMPELASLAEDEQRLILLEPGSVLLYEDECSLDLYWLIQGRIEVLRAGRRLAVLDGPGTLLGEMSVFGGCPRSATLRALDRSRLARIELDELASLLAGRPGVLQVLLAGMARRIDEAQVRIAEQQEQLQELRGEARRVRALLSANPPRAVLAREQLDRLLRESEARALRAVANPSSED